MKKVRIVICACWVSLWALSGQVDGSTMPFRNATQNASEDIFVGLLIRESCDYLVHTKKEPDFSLAFYRLPKGRVYNAKLVGDYMEVFRRSETRSPNAPALAPGLSDKDQPGKALSNEVIGSLTGTSTYDLGIKDHSMEWLIFIGVSLCLLGAMIFGMIAKLPGAILIIVWLIFWKPIVMAMIMAMSFVNSILLLF